MYFLRKCSLRQDVSISFDLSTISHHFLKVKLLCTESFECSEFSFHEMIITAQCRSPTVITSEYILLNPVSQEMISDSVVLYEKIACPTHWFERTTPEHAQNDSSEVDLLSFCCSPMSESWNNLNLFSST